jgi:CheY-like chemotaxis protein
MDKIQFRTNVKDILNHISDGAYLENHNLMTLLLTPEEARQANRLRLLRSKISQGVDVLRPPEDTPAHAAEWRCHRILTLRYLNLMEFHQIEYELGLSQRQVQRDLKKGLDALISILWNQLPAREPGSGDADEIGDEISDSVDLEVIQEELKNWEISFDLYNLHQVIEQALQLTASSLKTDLLERVDFSGVDRELNVMVDQILTTQGLYKIMAMLGPDDLDGTIGMRTRKISNHFVELSFQFDTRQPLNLDNWQIAQLMFTIQGVNHHLTQNPEQATISVVLPLTLQNSCLVIDDVVSVRRLIERMLGAYGVQVFGAGTHQEAINLAQLMKPDFILLDVLMPKMDGWQMLKILKANPETSDIPVIICSVLYEPELSKKAGAAAYIRKPINRIELIHTLQEKGFIKGEAQGINDETDG